MEVILRKSVAVQRGALCAVGISFAQADGAGRMRRRRRRGSLRRPTKPRRSRARYFVTPPQNRGNPATQSRASKSPRGDRIGRPPDRAITRARKRMSKAGETLPAQSSGG